MQVTQIYERLAAKQRSRPVGEQQGGQGLLQDLVGEWQWYTTWVQAVGDTSGLLDALAAR